MARAVLAATLLLVPAGAAEAAPLRVLVTGDSMVRPLDDLMERRLERGDVRVLKDPRVGTGLTRPLVLDWPRHARRQVRRYRPGATVMFLGAGDSEPLQTASGPQVSCCQRAWIDAYAERVEQMMRTYMRRKRRHVYWLTLAMPRQESRRQQFLAINYAIKQAARKAGAKAHVVDTVPALSPGGRFRRRLRYRGDLVVVRHGDGVHLTTAGARIARDLVVRAMRADGLLGGAARVAATAGTASLIYEKPIPELEIPAAYALSVEAGRAQANRIAVTESDDAYVVSDSGAALRPGQGCVALTSQAVRCPTTRTVGDRSVFVDAGDRGDHVSLKSLAARSMAEARSGGGSDLIFGGVGNDRLLGGGGVDGLSGGGGVDMLDGGRGDDVLHGGPDHDAVSYQLRQRPVTVDLGRRTGGGRGETDQILEVEGVIGTSGADDLRGTSGDDALVGGAGKAHDRVEGRAGNDGLIAYRAIGGRGDDVLDSFRPACGGGRDSVFRRTHNPEGPFAPRCERLYAIFIVIRPDPLRSARRSAVFALRCQRPDSRCRGALELRDRRRVLGRASFSLARRGESLALHRVRIPFARRAERRVATLHVSGVRAFQESSFKVRLG